MFFSLGLVGSKGSLAEDGCAGQGRFCPARPQTRTVGAAMIVVNTCALQTTAAQYFSKSCDRTIAGKLTNQLDRVWGWEAESSMRVASLESVLAVATLVLAIVVMLWGIKIFYGV
jgi:hypothetical protein